MLARIGVLSYGIYLIHDVVLEAMSSSLHVSIPSWGRLTIALALSIAYASCLDRYLDPYFRRKRGALR